MPVGDFVNYIQNVTIYNVINVIKTPIPSDSTILFLFHAHQKQNWM